MQAERARWAITTVFAFCGILIGSMVVRMPSLKLDLGLSAGDLGLVTAVSGAAAVVAMQSAGRIATRVGSRPVLRVVTLVLLAALVGIGLAPGITSLIVLQVVFGAAQGTLDVTMNTHAVSVERALGRHVMNGCHAAWSIGAVLGSLLGSGAAQAGLGRGLHFGLLAALLLPVALAAGQGLLPADADRSIAGKPPRRGRRAGWTPRVVVFGAMGAAALTVEAAVALWSGVFLHENLGASLGAAAFGYLAFATSQTAGRLVGDRLLARGSAAHLVRSGALCAAAGMAVVVAAPWPAVSIAGFAVVGAGLATPLPVLFAVVGHLGAGRGEYAGSAAAVARFATITFTGLLLAPAAVGWVADGIGLTWTLAALIPLLVAVAGLAGTVTRAATAPVAPAMATTAR